jgi:hypothetical protein
MQAPKNKCSDVIIAFPSEPARRCAASPMPAVLASVGASHRGIVVPLHCGHAARRAALCVKVRRLHAEIEALMSASGNWPRSQVQVPPFD